MSIISSLFELSEKTLDSDIKCFLVGGIGDQREGENPNPPSPQPQHKSVGVLEQAKPFPLIFR